MSTKLFISYLVLVHSMTYALEPVDRYFLNSCSKEDTISSSEGAASALGALIPSKAIHSYCDPTGIRPKKDRPYLLESNHTLAGFQEHFKEKGRLSVSIWMTPTDKPSLDDELRPILTFGHRGERQLRAARPSKCNGYHFRMAQMNAALMISFIDQHGVCQTLEPVELRPVLTHVALAFDSDNMQVFVDGTPLFRKGKLNTTTNVRSWNSVAEGSLQLFSNYGGSGVFQGSISQVALFNETLLVSDAASLFALGAGPINQTTIAPTPNKTKEPTFAPSLPPSRSPSEAPSAVPFPSKTQSPTATPTNPDTKPPQGFKAPTPVSTPFSPPFVYLRPAPTPPPSAAPTTLVNPAPPPDTKAWQFLVFGVFGTMMACFCLFNFVGGWPRFMAHRSKSIDVC